MIKQSNIIHFKFYRLLEWIGFLIDYSFHHTFHKQPPFGETPCWSNIRGSISCECGFCHDLGMSYGMHCEKCYNRICNIKRENENSN